MARTFELAEKIYFCDNNIVYVGFIEKINNNIMNVLVDDFSEEKGYHVWKIEEFFLAKDSKEAKLRWEDYQSRLNDFKSLLKIKRKQHNFINGVSVNVKPFNKDSYKAMVLSISKSSLVIVTEKNEFKRVDKAICMPINELINFKLGDKSNEQN